MEAIRLTDPGASGTVTQVFQFTVYVEGLQAARAGDIFTHTTLGPAPIPTPSRAVKTYIAGLPAIVVGDLTGQGGVFLSGSSKVFILA